MRKSEFIFLVFVLLANLICAEKAADFPGLTRPYLIHADDTQLYISDGTNVFIYSLHDYRLVKKFGRSGEGPREFKVNPNIGGGSVVIFLQSDRIVVNSIGKVSFFSKDGKYIKEIHTGTGGLRFQPMGKLFIGEEFATDKNISYLTRNIYNHQFEKQKEIYRRKAFYQVQSDLNPFHLTVPVTYIYDNKIFILAEMNEIYVFEKNGEKIYSIKPGYNKLLIKEDFKKKFHHWFQNHLAFKRFYNTLKDRFKFPKYFPLIRYYHVADNKVYILTYKEKGEKSEFLIYDIKGNHLKSIMVALAEQNDFAFLSYPYTIKNDKLYQLVENVDEEEWELYVTEIK